MRCWCGVILGIDDDHIRGLCANHANPLKPYNYFKTNKYAEWFKEYHKQYIEEVYKISL